MQRLLPIVICGLIGAVVVMVVLSQRETPEEDKIASTPTVDPSPKTPVVKDQFGPLRGTRTSVKEFKELSELERALKQKSRRGLAHFQALVCMKMDQVLDSKKHTETLLSLIKEYGSNGDDPAVRDIMFQMLRVFPTAEATEIIEQEYYRARSNSERLILLDALSRSYHNPALASVHIVDYCLNAPSADDREHSFYFMKQYSGDDFLVFDTARQIYEGTTQSQQGYLMLTSISDVAHKDERIRKWARSHMLTVRMDELPKLMSNIENWAEAEDTRVVEQLQERHPAMSGYLQTIAERLRAKLRAMERMEREAAGEAMDPAEEAAREKVHKPGDE
ncbi:MAG: hypothetical protein V3T86_13050 [Planctomycetota bacterium]